MMTLDFRDAPLYFVQEHLIFLGVPAFVGALTGGAVVEV